MAQSSSEKKSEILGRRMIDQLPAEIKVKIQGELWSQKELVNIFSEDPKKNQRDRMKLLGLNKRMREDTLPKASTNEYIPALPREKAYHSQYFPDLRHIQTGDDDENCGCGWAFDSDTQEPKVTNPIVESDVDVLLLKLENEPSLWEYIETLVLPLYVGDSPKNSEERDKSNSVVQEILKQRSAWYEDRKKSGKDLCTVTLQIPIPFVQSQESSSTEHQAGPEPSYNTEYLERLVSLGVASKGMLDSFAVRYDSAIEKEKFQNLVEYAREPLDWHNILDGIVWLHHEMLSSSLEKPRPLYPHWNPTCIESLQHFSGHVESASVLANRPEDEGQFLQGAPDAHSVFLSDYGGEYRGSIRSTYQTMSEILTERKQLRRLCLLTSQHGPSGRGERPNEYVCRLDDLNLTHLHITLDLLFGFKKSGKEKEEARLPPSLKYLILEMRMIRKERLEWAISAISRVVEKALALPDIKKVTLIVDRKIWYDEFSPETYDDLLENLQMLRKTDGKFRFHIESKEESLKAEKAYAEIKDARLGAEERRRAAMNDAA